MDLIVLMGDSPREIEDLAAGIASASPHTVYRKSIQDFIKTTTMRRFGLADDFWKGIEDENVSMYEFGARTAKECYEETEARGRELDRYFWVRLWLEALEYEAIALPDSAQVIFDNLTHEDDLDYLLGNFGHNSMVLRLSPESIYTEDMEDTAPFSKWSKIRSLINDKGCYALSLAREREDRVSVFVDYYKGKLARRNAA